MTHGETDRCPLGFRCESCGAAGSDRSVLRVSVLTVLGKRLCLTMCPKCAASGRLPAIQVSTAITLVEQHARHVAPIELRRIIGPRADAS